MSVLLAWIFLLISGLLDVLWAISMKKADGFNNLPWSAFSLIVLAAFVILLTRAMSVLPLGVAYSAWVGIGAIGSVVAGAVFFGENITPASVASCALIFLGIVGLKLASA